MDKLQDMSVSELVGYLLKCREKKSAIKAKADEAMQGVKNIEDAIETILLSRKDEQGVDKFSTPEATVFWSSYRSVKVEDWDKFNELVKDNPQLVTQTIVKGEVLDLLDNGMVIPGVKVSGILRMSLRGKK